jgi:hypothetical protein
LVSLGLSGFCPDAIPVGFCGPSFVLALCRGVRWGVGVGVWWWSCGWGFGGVFENWIVDASI